METMKYITAIIRYYKLSTITLRSGKKNRKKIYIRISGKISLISIIIWIVMSIFFIMSAMGTDPINIVTVNNEFSTITYNKKWWIYIIVAIVIMIFTIIKSLFLFKKLEHKPLNLNIYQREKPSNLRPAHVRMILNDGLVDEVSVAATLLDLIDRGYLSIEKYANMKEKIFKNKEIILRKTEKKTDDLMKFEKFIIEWFIDKYGDVKEVSMQDIENRLKKNFDEESPSDLFEHWVGLVFLSFPLKKFYKEYRGNNNKAYIIYIVFTMLGIIPILPFVRNFRDIWMGVYIVCIPNISIK